MDAPMENVIFAFKSEIIKNSKDIKDFTCLLQLTDENKFFSLQKTYGLQETISYIHGCLNTSKLRTEGLVLLEKLTEQCVTEVFTQNAVTWIKFIIQCLESHDPVEVKRLSCRVGCKIIPLTVNFTALSKDIISVLPQLLATLIAASSEWLTASLKLLGVCIQSYPGPCGTFKTKLEAMVTELFKEQSVPKEAISLYVLLARVGGGGNKGIHFTEAWSYKFQQIVTSLTEVVNLLYNGLNIPELESTFTVQVLPMRELPETYTNRFNILSSYHRTYCLCLQELLSQPFPAPVKIPVSDVIRLVTKVLSVNIRDLTLRPSTERLLLSGYISTLHSDAVLCLHSLISRCKTLLLPYSKSIITVMVKELMLFRTKVVYGQNRAHSSLRQLVYKTLALWLQTTKSFTITTDEDDWLVQEIIHDVRPHTDNMKTVSIKTKKDSFEPPPSKKKKKGGYSEISHGISTQKKVDLEANSELCMVALEVLYWFLTTVGCQLKQKLIEELQEFLISVAITFRCKGNYGIPYADDRCRHSLLRVMQAFNVMPHPTASSLLHYSLSVLRCTSQDTSLLVSSYSLESLQACEALIHARAPSYNVRKTVSREVIEDKIDIIQQDKAAERSSIYLSGQKTSSLFESVGEKHKDNGESKKIFTEKNVKESNVEDIYERKQKHGGHGDSDNQLSKIIDHTFTKSTNNQGQIKANLFNERQSKMEEQDANMMDTDVDDTPGGLMESSVNQKDTVESSTPEILLKENNSEGVKKEEEKQTLSNEDQENIVDMLSAFVDIDEDQ
ncbi:proline-, glutamic acid- and leucine-rich protein 1-like [Mytilus trossulus]|uniref:proline-, glutamic acid- and leucine-rich protein 1-like n=1 Tax=Mytilus trossulus TaxID=6551 RepID=UPI0030079391